MKERFAFKEEFEPVVNIGENVQLFPLKDDKTGVKYVKVLYIESLPFLLHDFGAVAAGAVAQVEFVELYLDDNEFGQFRVVPLVDDLTIDQLAQPRVNRRWVTRNSNWQSLYEFADPRMNPMIEKYHLNEIFQHEDDGLFVVPSSVGGLAVSTVGCYGFRYVFEKLETKPTVFTPIPVRGYRTVVRE